MQKYEYDSFGRIKHLGHLIEQPYAFTAREYDKETGLYYYRARYYDAEVGRFLSRDNLAGFPYKPWGLNRYSYVYNNPVNITDPSGNWAVVDDVIVSALGAAGGLMGQYASDVIGNIVDGRTGFGILVPSSSWKIYTVSALGGAATAEVAYLLLPLGPLAVGIGAGAGAGITSLAQDWVSGEELDYRDATINAGVTAVTAGVMETFPKVPGRWPNLFTKSFWTGEHTQRILIENLISEGVKIDRQIFQKILEISKMDIQIIPISINGK